MEGYFAKQTGSAVVQRICEPPYCETWRPYHLSGATQLKHPPPPTRTCNGYNNEGFLRKAVRRKPSDGVPVLTDHPAGFHGVYPHSILSVRLSIGPARRDSLIIVTLTRGSVRQPEDLLLEIETRHLSDASCLPPSDSHPRVACRITRWVPDHTLLHRPQYGLSAQCSSCCTISKIKCLENN